MDLFSFFKKIKIPEAEPASTIIINFENAVTTFSRLLVKEHGDCSEIIRLQLLLNYIDITGIEKKVKQDQITMDLVFTYYHEKYYKNEEVTIFQVISRFKNHAQTLNIIRYQLDEILSNKKFKPLWTAYLCLDESHPTFLMPIIGHALKANSITAMCTGAARNIFGELYNSETLTKSSQEILKTLLNNKL